MGNVTGPWGSGISGTMRGRAAVKEASPAVLGCSAGRGGACSRSRSRAEVAADARGLMKGLSDRHIDHAPARTAPVIPASMRVRCG